MAFVPPWLNVTPQSFAESYANGVRAGLNASAQRQQAQQSAARMAQVEAEERRREWETQQRFALEQQGLAQRKELGLENLRAQQAWRNASMGIDRERLAETGRHNLATEGMNPYKQAQMDRWKQNKLFHVGNSIVSISPEGEKTVVVPSELSPTDAARFLEKGDFSDMSAEEAMDVKNALKNKARSGIGLPPVPRQQVTTNIVETPWYRPNKTELKTNTLPPLGVPSLSAPTSLKTPQFKEGDKIRSKVDGKIYIVRNGEPVLMEGQ